MLSPPFAMLHREEDLTEPGNQLAYSLPSLSYVAQGRRSHRTWEVAGAYPFLLCHAAQGRRSPITSVMPPGPHGPHPLASLSWAFGLMTATGQTSTLCAAAGGEHLSFCPPKTQRYGLACHAWIGRAKAVWAWPVMLGWEGEGSVGPGLSCLDWRAKAV